jgi:hypothetical protein
VTLRSLRNEHLRRIAAPLLAVILFAPSAVAAPPAPSASGTPAPAKSPAQTAADKRAAQKLLAQGNQLLGEGDYVSALDKFRTAYDKFPSPKLLLNIGTTLRQLGRNVEAAEVYEKYLREPEHDTAREKDVKRVLDEIDAVVGRIVITVDDPGASVRLDGKALENFVSGQSRRVDLGEHQVTADKPGKTTVVQNVVVHGRQEYQLALRFAPPPPPPDSSVPRTLALSFGGIGILAVGAGAVAGIVASVQNSQAAGNCFRGGGACGTKGADKGRAAQTAATISTVGFSAGLGLVATGTLIYLLGSAGSGPRPPAGLGLEVPSRSSRRSVAAAPWISIDPLPSGAAMSIGGAF